MSPRQAGLSPPGHRVWEGRKWKAVRTAAPECVRVGPARSGRPSGLPGSARRRVALRARTRSFERRGPAHSAPARPDRGRRGHRPASQPSRRTPHLGCRSPRVPLRTPPRPGCDSDPFSRSVPAALPGPAQTRRGRFCRQPRPRRPRRARCARPIGCRDSDPALQPRPRSGLDRPTQGRHAPKHAQGDFPGAQLETPTASRSHARQPTSERMEHLYSCCSGLESALLVPRCLGTLGGCASCEFEASPGYRGGCASRS
ncbi:serine/arginine repetitive matrix protein 3-like [Peromyscus leucopus]|uniref:serine/arginine repetitive matrix protein 3-like n=1 Tax=Peromyscus leucopus TaxID=10041 RepID=UPI0018858522|nr:serine/arginine repetitive matrix protein 3-like [Peromyscus leucopus]